MMLMPSRRCAHMALSIIDPSFHLIFRPLRHAGERTHERTPSRSPRARTPDDAS